MPARRLFFIVGAILLGFAAFLALRPKNRGGNLAASASHSTDSSSITSASAPAPVSPPSTSTSNSQLPPPTAVVAGSPIADTLNAPDGTIRRDLAILNELFGAFQSNFPRLGNPVGENAEITAALTGANPAQFVFISPRHRAINARGELCDRWGTPFRFHQMSGTQMEIRSAGPDRKFATPDDVEFTPGAK